MVQVTYNPALCSMLLNGKGGMKYMGNYKLASLAGKMRYAL